MNINVVRGIGVGKTKISAFDMALNNAGVDNFNLIRLSSIIPPGSIVKKIARFEQKKEDYGKKLYVVMARSFEEIKEKEAWAGIGWSQDSSRKGVFTEHHHHSKDALTKEMKDSLSELQRFRDQFGGMDFEFAGITCERDIVCALVIALYKIENWT